MSDLVQISSGCSPVIPTDRAFPGPACPWSDTGPGRERLIISCYRSLFRHRHKQVLPDTLDSAVASLNLDPKQRFTPELQDRIFSQYLVTDKRPEVRD